MHRFNKSANTIWLWVYMRLQKPAQFVYTTTETRDTRILYY